MADAEIANTELPPRGRGRPGRKAAELASNAMKELASKNNASDANDGEPKAKRGRGRPRKADAKPKEAKKGTGRRGRPPKNPKPTSDSGAKEASAAAASA